MLPEVRQTVAGLDGPIIEKQFHAEPLPNVQTRLRVRQLFQRKSSPKTNFYGGNDSNPKKALMKYTLPVIPNQLQAIPEILEAHQIMHTESLAMSDAIEITIPAMSPEDRGLLQDYLRKVEENSYYVTDHWTEDEGEIIQIRLCPLELLCSGGAVN